jgi:drug/metabolite transporter (DMT)-like permease
MSAYLILFGAQLAIGAAAIFARFALHGSGPVMVSALRLTIAAVPVFIFSLKARGKHEVLRSHELLFALAGLALAVHFSTWIASLLYTSVAVSTLLVTTAPVWTALYDIVVLKKKMPVLFWWAFLAGACGTYLIVCTETGGTAPAGGNVLLGEFLAFVGGIAIAAYLIAIRSVSHRYPTLLVVGRTYSWAALLLLIAACCARQTMPGNDLVSWGGIFAMALVSQLLGHTGLNASLRFFTPTVVAFTTLLEPVFAAILATMIFMERLSFHTIGGCLIVLAALAIILRIQPAESADSRETANVSHSP